MRRHLPLPCWLRHVREIGHSHVVSNEASSVHFITADGFDRRGFTDTVTGARARVSTCFVDFFT